MRTAWLMVIFNYSKFECAIRWAAMHNLLPAALFCSQYLDFLVSLSSSLCTLENEEQAEWGRQQRDQKSWKMVIVYRSAARRPSGELCFGNWYSSLWVVDCEKCSMGLLRKILTFDKLQGKMRSLRRVWVMEPLILVPWMSWHLHHDERTCVCAMKLI